MGRLRVDGCELSFEEAGAGSTLVLIHGLGNDLRFWDRHVDALAERHRVVRYDVRGFGASEKPPGPYSPEIFARDLDEFLTGIGVRDAHVLGISMGGVIGQRFALDYRHRVRSLVLVSTSSEVGPKSVAAWQRLADTIEREGFDARSADASRAFSASFVAAHPDVVAEAGRVNAACDPRGYAAAARAVSDYRWTDSLRRLDLPVLILQGLDDRLTPPGGSVKMSRVLPRALLLMVPDCGHNLPVEQPVFFRTAVLAFAAGVDFAHA